MAIKKTHNKAPKKKTTIGKSPLTKRKQPGGPTRRQQGLQEALSRSGTVKSQTSTLFMSGGFHFESN
jgi:hypothetical protein